MIKHYASRPSDNAVGLTTERGNYYPGTQVWIGMITRIDPENQLREYVYKKDTITRVVYTDNEYRADGIVFEGEGFVLSETLCDMYTYRPEDPDPNVGVSDPTMNDLPF